MSLPAGGVRPVEKWPTRAAPGSSLCAISGFDIGLAYSSFLTATQAWAEIQRLVDEHERRGVDRLLISAGAPDSNGMMYPAGGVLAGFVVDHPIGLVRPPTHIQTVLLQLGDGIRNYLIS